MVPHLITALNGPINELEARILESMPATERWFRLEWMEHTPTFYASVDLRNAGFKLAPVDTNLFPSGFNHLTAPMLPQAVQAAMAAIEKICPEARNLLVIPEPGKRCSFYLDHLATLARIFTQAGLNVRFGTLETGITEPTDLKLADGGTITLEPLVRKRGRLTLKGFDPCTILLNSDLAGGTPPQLMGTLMAPGPMAPNSFGSALRPKNGMSRSSIPSVSRYAPAIMIPAHLRTMQI